MFKKIKEVIKTPWYFTTRHYGVGQTDKDVKDAIERMRNYNQS